MTLYTYGYCALCADKVRQAPFEASSNQDLICEAIAINSSYTSEVVPSTNRGMAEQRGNKTECALLQYLASIGRYYRAIRAAHPEESFVKVYTFNSGRKSMTTVIAIPNGWRVFCKGAAEIVLAKCNKIQGEDGGVGELTSEDTERINKKVINTMANNGLRAICVAHKDIIGKGLPNFEDESTVVIY